MSINGSTYFGIAGLILLINASIQAQSQVEYGYSRTIRIYAPTFKPYEDVYGSPFIPGDSVQHGWLLIGTKQVPARVRYNSYTGEVEYVQGSKILTPASSVAEFAILETDTLHFRKGFPAVGTWSTNDFYQLIYNGRKTKLVKRIVSVIKSNTDAMANDLGKKQFQKREEYYVWMAKSQPPADNYFEKLSDGTMKSVVASKKSLISLFPQSAEPINRYLADQKIKLKSWSEFASVLRYLESQ